MSPRLAVIHPAVFKDAFYFVLVSPPPGGSRGRVQKEIVGFGPIPARRASQLMPSAACMSPRLAIIQKRFRHDLKHGSVVISNMYVAETVADWIWICYVLKPAGKCTEH